MITRSLMKLGSGAVAVLMTTNGMAEEGAAAGPKVGFEYRGGMTYSDNKIYDEDASSSTDVSLERANFTVNGTAGKGMDYRVRYNLLKNTLEYGYFTQDFGMLKLLVGRTKLKQGGWEVRNNGTWILNTSEAFSNLPLSKYSDVLAVELDVAGKLTIQIANDVAGRVRQPIYALEWIGNFGGISPLVQYGRYDLDNSQYFDVGVKYKQGGLDVEFDYFAKMDVTTVGDDKFTKTTSNLHAQAEYSLKGFTPFAKFDMFNVAQPEDSDLGMEDGTTNSGVDANGNLVIDDNSTRITVGSWVDAWGEHFRPYAALFYNTGNFMNADGDEESRSNMALNVGVAGKF